MTRTIVLLALLAGAVSYPLLTNENSSWQGEPIFNLQEYLTSPTDQASAFSSAAGSTNPSSFSQFNSGTFLPSATAPHVGLNQAGGPAVVPVSGPPIIWRGPTAPPPRVYQPVSNLGEVIRFDVFPNWVKARWPRVSTPPGELNLEGLRVPLVTGSSSHDLAGALTYYFDQRHQVQRICFQGWTSDARYLVQFLTEEYGFKTQPTRLAGLYVKKTFFGGNHSVLRLEHLPIVNQSQPQRQLFVFLELNHPRGNLPLSSLAQQALTSDQ